MSIFNEANVKKMRDRLESITVNEEKVFEAGKRVGRLDGYREGYVDGVADKDTKGQFELGEAFAYNEFWNTMQKNGARVNYQYAFCNEGWNDITFKPKYDMILGIGYTGYSMFWGCHVSNIKQRLEDLGLKLDTSSAWHLSSAFQNARSVALPKIDLSGAKNGTNHCFASEYIESIDEIVFSDNTKIEAQIFNNAKSLKSVAFSGEICGSIDIHWSILLDKESIKSLINHLSDNVSGMTLTLSKDAVDEAFKYYDYIFDYPEDSRWIIGSKTGTWIELADTKPNWEIVLV